MRPILLIDGDQFLYRACAACEEEVRWDDENHVLFSNAVEATKVAIGSIEKVVAKLKPSQVRLAFTKTDSFRLDVYPHYKGSRKAVRKPMGYVRVREALEEKYQSLDLPGLEADDILGIWATRDDRDYIIVSDDKDLRTIPGKLYRQDKLEHITPAQADYNWMFQTLIGDVTDGYPGCPGVGEETAKRVLDGMTALESYEHELLRGPRKGQVETRWRPITAENHWHVVVSHYEAAGLTAEDALVQARCARILRATDWDTKKKEVILWSP